MAQEFVHKPGTGSMFKNKYKEENDKAPVYKGVVVTPSGETLKISAWLSDGKAGKFISLRLSEPMKKQETPMPKEQTRFQGGRAEEPIREENDRELPF